MCRTIRALGASAAAVTLSCLAASVGVAQAAASTGSSASFRGLGIAPDGAIWVSGAEGTVLRSIDGGAHWELRPIADARSFQLRDIEAVSATTAYAMVAATDTGMIYKTTDGGRHWVRQYDETRKGIFLDGLAFWDELHGIAFGDPLEERFVILRTEDGGVHWVPIPAQDAPRAEHREAAFAASGTSITVSPGGRVWIGTGANEGSGVARVLRSTDYGRTWQASATPIPSGTQSTGILSLAFRDSLNGIAVGGDYKAPEADRSNVAFTTDGGKTWRLGDTTKATGYLSAVAYAPKAGAGALVAVGVVGMFDSFDEGRTWRRLNADSYNAVAAGKVIVAAGDQGRVGVWPSSAAAQDKSTPLLQRR